MINDCGNDPVCINNGLKDAAHVTSPVWDSIRALDPTFLPPLVSYFEPTKYVHQRLRTALLIESDKNFFCSRAGLSGAACDRGFQEYSAATGGLAGLIIDFTPVVGDVKGAVECVADISWSACLGAVAGLIPVLGDVVRVSVRKGGHVIEAVSDGSGGFRVSETKDVGIFDGAPNRTVSFTETGTGTHLRRTVDVDGQTVQINSGHAYNRTHSGGDVRDSGLSMDQIDSAIVTDIADNVNVGSLPQVPQVTSNTIKINGYSLTYDITRLPNGSVSVSTYYPGP